MADSDRRVVIEVSRRLIEQIVQGHMLPDGMDLVNPLPTDAQLVAVASQDYCQTIGFAFQSVSFAEIREWDALPRIALEYRRRSYELDPVEGLRRVKDDA